MANSWELPVGNMPSGTYRVDLGLDTQTVWREFFRVID
jgi:hypothetical protein